MYQLFVRLLQPYPWLFVAMLGSLVLLWRRGVSRVHLLIMTVPVVLLTIVNLPIVGDLAVGSLEWSYPPTSDRPEDVEAIVVLCGFVRPPDELSPEPELGIDTLQRCLHAARLYHRGPACPLIVSGGPLDSTPGPSMAETMGAFLVTLGVPEEDLVLEEEALSGFENAAYCAQLLEQRGITRVLLVTSAIHMPRAVRCFRAQGVDITPSASDHLTRPRWPIPTPASFWPNAIAAQKFQAAAREWIGLVWYRVRGRI